MVSEANLQQRENKKSTLFIILGFFFVTNALIAEFIGVKLFSLEATLGMDPVQWHILGFDLSFNLTAGVLLWPVVFIMTDLINEYYGHKGVRKLSYLTAIMISYAFLMVYVAIQTQPADFWVESKAGKGLSNFNLAYAEVFGQGLSIIIGSLTAFLVGQLVDAWVFRRVKLKTGSNQVWVRATASTLVSQLIDSFVVLFIAFYILGDFSFKQVIAIGIINYFYKVFMAFVLIPVLYGVHYLINRYLGKELSETMIGEAVN
jgi:uncharacterized integral membrane protein (TIGR00697 family)